MDERYAAVDVLGKGLVIFSALSGPNLRIRLPELIPVKQLLACWHRERRQGRD